MRRRTHGTRLVGTAIALALVSVACGDDDDGAAGQAEPVETSVQSGGTTATAETTSAGPDTTAAAATTATADTTTATQELTGYEAVYAAIDGLEGDARRQKLIELAAQESGVLSLYTAEIELLNKALGERFTADTGIEIEIFRESGVAILERLLQEKAAGNSNADVVLLNNAVMYNAEDEGICAELPEIPEAAGIIEGGLHEHWVVAILAEYMTMWNTDRIAEQDVPTTWKEVLSGRFDGTLGLESASWSKLGWIIHYVAESEGISDEEAVELVRPGFAGAVVVQGHSVLQGMLNTGEVDVGVQYRAVARPDIEAGAPVGYLPAVTPIPVEGSGLCTVVDSTMPASALLYLEWRITEGQTVAFDVNEVMGANEGYTPPVEEILGVSSDDIVLIPADIEAQYDKWFPIVEDLISESER